MRVVWIIGAVIAAGLLYAGYSHLSGRQALKIACADEEGAPQVRACTAIIENPGNLGNEDIASAFLNRGNGYADIGEYELALADYDESIMRDPDDFKTYHNRAMVFRNLEEYAFALKDHDTAIDLYPEHSWLYLERAETLYDDGQYEKCIGDLERVLEFDPEDAAVLNSIAWTMLILGRPGEALPYAVRSLAADEEKFSGSLDTYAHVMSGLGRQEEAVSYFVKAARMGDAQYIREIQQALATKGLLDQPPDGLLTAGTMAALETCVAKKCRLLLPDIPAAD